MRAVACTISAGNAWVGTAAGVMLSSALACTSYSDALARGQRYYEDNQYERALALWRDLDRRGADFNAAERARYAYFRGMTDYRLGYRDDARHWLAIARAAESTQPGGLGSVWLERLDSALTDLARNPSRSAGSEADVVQTIEAHGVVLPDDASFDAPPGSSTPRSLIPGGSAPEVPATGSADPAGQVPARPADAGAAPASDTER
jgi:hypothetical protein